MQRAADDQRDRYGVGIHDEHVLEPERREFRERQHLVDRVDGCRMDSPRMNSVSHRISPKAAKRLNRGDQACNFRAQIRGVPAAQDA
jgi:hypothetical protein